MIKPGEIQRKANQDKVRDQQIEKDYVISWLLWGISQHKNLSKLLTFKGGTVLKKVYFNDYRFSEDLDFTLLKDGVSNEQIFEWLNEVFTNILEEANIPLEIIDDGDDKNAEDGINFYVSYVGPLGGLGHHKRVKFDISRSENLEFKPVIQDAIINYSDLEDYKLLCYPLEELLVEKLRCVMQRMQPRDYFDIWYLLEIEEMEIDFFVEEFTNKCESKGINPKEFHEKLNKKLSLYKARWEKSMSNQIKDLPDFDDVQREVHRHLKNWMK